MGVRFRFNQGPYLCDLILANVDPGHRRFPSLKLLRRILSQSIIPLAGGQSLNMSYVRDEALYLLPVFDEWFEWVCLGFWEGEVSVCGVCEEVAVCVGVLVLGEV